VADTSAATPLTHTHIGGQALLEGIMMRGKLNWAVAVRQPDGEIHVESHDLVSTVGKRSWLRWPIVRGVWAMYETLVLAMKAFAVSASFAGDTEEEQLSSGEIGWTMAIGLVLAVGVFIVLPALLTNGLGWLGTHGFTVLAWLGPKGQTFWWNLVDGLIRVLIFFGYIWGIGRISDIKRVFAYHGAEHKTIHAFEHGLPMDAEHIQQFDTLHIRCGTSFLLMVMIVAILVFSLVPSPNLWWRIGSRILLLPIVAGLAYEITVKWAGNHSENPLVKVLLWPGMQLQRLTTAEPDDSMVEVAVAAMRPVIEREEAAAAVGVPEPLT
jgi:uncharacterized protein YqhQ